MSFQNVKGTRDFYPPDMRVRNWLFDAWRRAALRNGFEEYDSPIFEYADLYIAKSGEQIVSELFSFTDRGGRHLAIRPETTPSLARMVNARINSLPRPIKWFCIQRLCRAENPQRGRLREFFQWNIDIIGNDSAVADAECVATAVDFLREVGLEDSDVQVRYSSRALTSGVLKAAGVPEASTPAVLAAIDKRSKVERGAFTEMLAKAVPDAGQMKAVLGFLDIDDLGQDAQEKIGRLRGLGVKLADTSAIGALDAFERHLHNMGLDRWMCYDPNTVRGLAYYTGIVYEIIPPGERALAGGGRYDNLLEVLGGPAVGATGFAMGDVVVSLLLRDRKLIPGELAMPLGGFFVVCGPRGGFQVLLEVVAKLRRKGHRVGYSHRAEDEQGLGKQLRDADRRGAEEAVIILDPDPRKKLVAVKNLRTGEQGEEMSVEEFMRKTGLGPYAHGASQRPLRGGV